MPPPKRGYEVANGRCPDAATGEFGDFIGRRRPIGEQPIDAFFFAVD